MYYNNSYNETTRKKILHLTLKKEYFDAISKGEKASEYREYKDYWKKRLLNTDGSYKNYDVILFKNGYNKNAPYFTIEFKSITVIKEKLSWFKSTKYFKIELGKILNKDDIMG